MGVRGRQGECQWPGAGRRTRRQLAMLRRVAGHLLASRHTPAAGVEVRGDEGHGTPAPRAVTTSDYPAANERAPDLSPEEAQHFRDFGCEPHLPYPPARPPQPAAQLPQPAPPPA